MKNPISAYIAEFIGTLLLVLIGCGAAVLGGPQIGMIGIAAAFGLALMALIYIFGPTSTGLMNPAVTLGFWISGKLETAHVIPYLLAQCAGGIAGAFILYHIATGKAGFVLDANFALNGFESHSPQKYSLVAAGLVETLLTGLLVLAVLATTAKGFSVGSEAIAVGVTLFAIHLIGLPVTNASFNFARSLGPALVVMDQSIIQQLYYFAGFHTLGALLAVVVHKLVHEKR